MSAAWTLEETDPTSGRQIFARPSEPIGKGDTGTHDFKIARDFQVRSAAGEVLLEAHGSAAGEYWCGAFLFFVDGSAGRQVRLDESDRAEDVIMDVPDTPLAPDAIRP
ncbi:hypothetical protein AIOL_003240 [Candidatus Rhodobacter oscarellae]|uniref:Uncharacterized protein n=1 Tax=Candidatus Rhodobacter oscarellae TaxID=1675527 RepID=A0A0J9E9C3_9RHOB|nr:hypothetical protein [Candidatus Rhodobacter lobularis]KMW58269.1 hypothetical protein AIOL_003240 [Candidatus Rhodobacter lobularis]